jgi:hypothetical protein
MARSLENMLNSDRKPWDREERDRYPFDDMKKMSQPQALLYGHLPMAAAIGP